MDRTMGWKMAEQAWRKGPWTPAEDDLLVKHVSMHGEGRWSSVARCSGLKRSGKSCRLRWVNYLRPGLKKGHLTPQEEGIIIELHALWGNKWSTIARYLPGRTDNEIKNYWRTNFKNQEKQKYKAPIKQNQHQLMNETSNLALPHAEQNKGTRFKLAQAKLQESTSEFVKNRSVMAQDGATSWDTVSEDCLWSGFVWNLDNGPPNEPVTKQ